MTSPKIVIGSIVIDLNDYKCQVIPKWERETIEYTSPLTGKKTVVNLDSDAEKGRFECRLRVQNADSLIKEIEGNSTVDFYLYSDESIHFDCIVKEFLPFEAGERHRRVSVASILLVSESRIYSPLVNPATPEADPMGYEFPNGTTIYVDLDCVTLGATIYYTKDDSIPDPTDTKWVGTSIPISNTTTIKARAYLGSSRYSGIMTEVYTEGTPT